MFETRPITAMIAPSLDAMGYRIVRVAFTGGRRPTLQIMAERRDAAAMSVDDCADISRTVSALLDVARLRADCVGHVASGCESPDDFRCRRAE